MQNVSLPFKIDAQLIWKQLLSQLEKVLLLIILHKFVISIVEINFSVLQKYITCSSAWSSFSQSGISSSISSKLDIIWKTLELIIISRADKKIVQIQGGIMVNYETSVLLFKW